MIEFYPYSPFLAQQPDGVMWKETDYHKQKSLEKHNPIFKKKGGRK